MVKKKKILTNFCDFFHQMNFGSSLIKSKDWIVYSVFGRAFIGFTLPTFLILVSHIMQKNRKCLNVYQFFINAIIEF